MIANATVVRVRRAPGGFDDYGDPVSSSETRVTMEGCIVAPRSSVAVGTSASTEASSRGRQGVIVGLTMFAPYGTDIVHTDQIEVDGELFEVEGEVGAWKSPFSEWEAGLEVALRRAAG